MKESQKNTQTEILACPRGLHESGDTQEVTMAYHALLLRETVNSQHL